MSNTPIAQVAISTIKGSDKQDIYPKTVDRAVMTTSPSGAATTLDKILIKEVNFNSEPKYVDNNNVLSINAPVIDSIETQESSQDGGTNVITIRTTDGEVKTLNVKNGNRGNSGYSGAAEELEVVNNLEDGGDTAALSAAMGKFLGEEIDSLKGITHYVKDATNDEAGKYIYTNGAIYGSSGWSVSREITLLAGQTINVKVTSTNSNSIVIGRVKNASTIYASDAIFPVSEQTNYKYTATADCTVRITYPTNNGFSAYIDGGNPVDNVDAKVETILSRLGGTTIPFDQPKTYTYVNNALVENNGSLTTGCSTAKLNIADYKVLFFSGSRTAFNGYFCAIFFDDNDNYVGWGLRPHDERSDTSLVTHTATYDMVNVLAEVPSGATKVVLQTNKDANPNSAVIAFTEMPYNFLQEEDWRQAYYGVVGDGVTDDSTALQNLLNNSRGEVTLRAGTYLIETALFVNATKLRKINGNGATIIVKGDITAFDIKGSTTDDASPSYEGDWRIAHAGFIIENLKITSDDDTEGLGIELTACFKPTIKNCYIYHIKDGIVMHRNRDVTIDGNNIYQCSGSGVSFANDASVHQCNITSNHISWCHNCILFDSPNQINNIQIVGNDIEVGHGYPVGDNCCIKMTADSTNVIYGEVEIVGNTIQGHTGSTSVVDVAGTSSKIIYGVTIVGNFISGATGADDGEGNAVMLANVRNIAVSANNFKGAKTSAIKLLANCSYISVSGNTIADPDRTIPLLTTASDANVTNVGISGNVGKNSSISISGSSQDYISVVENNLGGGTVTIGAATHKQEANNI